MYDLHIYNENEKARALWCLRSVYSKFFIKTKRLYISTANETEYEYISASPCVYVRVCAPFGMCVNTCLCMLVGLTLCVCMCVCLCLRGPFGLAKTSAPSYVRGLVWHLGNILYPALQHYTQFTAKGHYVPVNPLLIDISANSTTSQPHDRSLPPQNQKIAIWELKIEQ